MAFLLEALVIRISLIQGKVKLVRANGKFELTEFESADSKLLEKWSQIQRKWDLC